MFLAKILFKSEANKRTVQVSICARYHERENAHIERLKTLVPDQCKAVLVECTLSSTYVTKTDLGEGILSLLAYFSLMHLLNSQLKQQNVFFTVPSLSTIVNFSMCVLMHSLKNCCSQNTLAVFINVRQWVT
jgi:hypothetical protein